VSGNRERHRQVEELLRTGKTQEQAGDFVAAWNSLEEADRLATGGREKEAAQAELAMHWLETRWALTNKGSGKVWRESCHFSTGPYPNRTANGRLTFSLAVVGHNFSGRKTRLAYQDQDPNGTFTKRCKSTRRTCTLTSCRGTGSCGVSAAPAAVPGEVPVKLAEARKRFSLALAAGREHDYASWLQLTGLEGLHNPEADAEFVRLVNEMRKNREQIPRQTFNEIAKFYSSRLSPWMASGGSHSGPTVVVHSEERQPMLAALPTADQLATFSWIFDSADFNTSENITEPFCRKRVASVPRPCNPCWRPDRRCPATILNSDS
jgi:hypothetical protein